MFDAYALEIALARAAFRNRELAECFFHLERAHILGQRSTLRHCYAHWLMLRAGLRLRDPREVLGQVVRIMTAILFSRIWVPIGNTGRARINALKPMPVPEDLQQLMA